MFNSRILECAICKEYITVNDIFYTPCSHAFNYRCISEWLKSSRTCPECRQVIHPEQVRRLHVNFSNHNIFLDEWKKWKKRFEELQSQLVRCQDELQAKEMESTMAAERARRAVVLKKYAQEHEEYLQLQKDLKICKTKNRAQERKIKELTKLIPPSLAKNSEKKAKQGAKTAPVVPTAPTVPSKKRRSTEATVGPSDQAIASRTRSRTHQ